MDVGELKERLREKWENFSYWLEERRIPKPVFFGAVAIAVIAIIFLLLHSMDFFGPEEKAVLRVMVVDRHGEPIPDALVVVSSDFFDSMEKMTGAGGDAVFEVPVNRDFSVEASYEGVFERKELRIESDQMERIVLGVELISYFDKRIIFFRGDSGEKDTSVGEFRAYCSAADWERTAVASEGEAIVREVPSNCGNLIVKIGDKTYATEEIDSTPFEIRLAEEKSEGLVTAFVMDSETGEAVGAEEVSGVLLNEFMQQVSGPVYSDDAGALVFENIRAGRYSVKLSGLGNYADVRTDYRDLREGENLNFEIEAEKTVSFQIKVRVVDAEGKAVESAKLNLKDLEDNTLVQDRWTDERGEFVFNVGEEKTYNLAVSVGDWVRRLEVYPREEFYEVTYSPEELDEAGRVIVSVTDLEKEPLANAKVELFTQDHKASGYESVTGSDGKSELKVMPGVYYAKASVSNFPPASSETFTVRPYQEEPILIELEIEVPRGSFEIEVADREGNAIENAEVLAIDIESRETLGKRHTDSEGFAELGVRADKKAYFIVNAEDFLPYTTLPVKPVAGSVSEKKIVLQRSAEQVKIEFDGLFIDDEQVRSELSKGMVYTARLRLVVPEGFREAGIHFRTGEERETGVIMEEDIVFISQSISSSEKILKGSSFTPPTGSNADLSTASENSKWVEHIWRLGEKGAPEAGVFELEAKVTVRDTAMEGETAKISYRGYAVEQEYERDPHDSVLKGAKDTAEKHGLYAAAYEKIYSIGITDLCDGTHCRSFSIKDLETGSTRAVVEAYPAKVAGKYRINFYINRQASGTASNLLMEIGDRQQALSFSEYYISAPDGTEKRGSGERRVSEEIGSMPQNTRITGYADFEILKEGKVNLYITLSDGTRKVFEKAIVLEIEPGKELSVSVVPKIIIPNIKNNILLRFEDSEKEQGVEGVSVSALLDNEVIASGITDFDGVFPFELQAPAAGSTITVIGRKTGFDVLRHEIKVDSEIFRLVPPKIDLDLRAEAREEAEVRLSIENQTAVPFTVKGISVDGLEEFASIEGAEQYYGREVMPNESLELELNARLTEKGRVLEATKNLRASINVSIENEELSKEWSSSSELNLRILLGGELDNLNCLDIEPSDWKVESFGETKRMSFFLENNCTVNAEPVPLRYAKARVRWRGESPIGIFSISGDLEEGRIEIGSARREISGEIPAGFEGEVILSFIPSQDIHTASAEPVIEIEGEHFSDSGREVAKASVSTEINVNILKECLRIIRPEEIELKTCGFDTGWDLSSRYFDRDPYATEPEPVQPAWPGIQYTPPWQTTYSHSPYQQDRQWECEDEKMEIIIENACSEAVEITFRADSGLTAEPSTTTVDAISSKAIEISPSTRIGRFNAKIMAKFKGAKSFADEIDSFRVRVVRHDEMSEKCIPVIEPDVLRANFLGWQRTVARVYNKCYHLGYSLQHPTEENFHCYTPKNGGTSLEGPCPLIRNVVVAGTRIEEVSESEAWEVMEVNIWFDPSVEEMKGFDWDGSPDQQIGNLRVTATEFYTAVISPGVISVPLNIPNLGKKYFPTEVTFVDPFQWLGIAGSFIDKGSPDLEPADCLNRNALNLPVHGAEVIGDIHFDDDVFVWNKNPPMSKMVMPIARSNEELEREEKTCGREDYISGIGFNTWEDPQSGVRINFNISDDRHNIVMSIDRSNMVTKCARINLPLPVKVTRKYYNAGTQETRIPVVANILNHGITSLEDGCEKESAEAAFLPGWAQPKPCGTVPDDYRRYGFDKQLFTWSVEEIGPAACSPDNYYCDGSQFILQLSHNIRAVNDEIIEKLNQEASVDPHYRNVLNAIGEKPELAREINEEAGKLFKISKNQIIVHDSVQNKNLLFFVGWNGELLNAPVIAESVQRCTAGNIMTDFGFLESVIKGESAPDAYPLTQIIRKSELEKKMEHCYPQGIGTENIIGVIDEKRAPTWTEKPGAWEKIMQEIALEEESMNRHLITFNEYKALQNNLIHELFNMEEGQELITIDIGRTRITASEEEWVIVLNALVNSTYFVTGVLNEAGMPAMLEDYVRREAEDVVETEWPMITIEPSKAALKSDNLSEILVSDVLGTVLSDLGINPDQLVFNRFYSNEFEREIPQARPDRCVVDAGIYYYRLDPKITVGFGRRPSIALNKFEVKLALDKPLGEVNSLYAQNALFYTPFNTFGRRPRVNADYGIGITVPENVEIFTQHRDEGDWTRLYTIQEGFRKLSLDYGETFEKTRAGTVLDLDLGRSRFGFYPSIPVMLQLHTLKEGTNVVYYRLSDPRFYGNIDGLFGWMGDRKNTVDSFEEFTPEAFCDEWRSRARAARVALESGVWNSMAFVPVGSGVAERYLDIEILCARNEVLLSAFLVEGEEWRETRPTTGPAGGAVRIGEPRAAYWSIEDYINRIGHGICIDVISSDRLRLRWDNDPYGGE